MSETVLIVGVGTGLSASLARVFANNDMKIVLAARDIKKLKPLANKISAETITCDASDINSVTSLFELTDKLIGTPNLVIYNPSARLKGNIVELDPSESKKAINITCFGAFLIAQQAVRRMLLRGSGSIFFTGATASIKGFANFKKGQSF